MGKFKGNVRSTSSLKALLLMIIVVVIAITLTYSWLNPIEAGGIKVYVEPHIYNPSHNIGILNEEAIFMISIDNYEDFNATISVVINAEDRVVINETFMVKPRSSQNRTISQKLISTGLWIVEVAELPDGHRFLIESYSFVSVINEVEADMKINQRNELQFNKTLSIVAIIIALLSLITNIVRAIYTRKH